MILNNSKFDIFNFNMSWTILTVVTTSTVLLNWYLFKEKLTLK
jgi:hypothetical protein